MKTHVGVALRLETRDILRRIARIEGRSVCEVVHRAALERLAKHRPSAPAAKEEAAHA